MVFQRMAEAACTLRGQWHNHERCKCDTRGAAGSCRWNCQTPLEQVLWSLWKQTVTGDYEDATPEDNVFKHWVSLHKLSDASSSQHLKEKSQQLQQKEKFPKPSWCLVWPWSSALLCSGEQGSVQGISYSAGFKPKLPPNAGGAQGRTFHLSLQDICLHFLAFS